MAESYKEQLSNHVENIFKKYVSPGLHICDIATGGGKSYTIGKLTCQYYPVHFDRIIILCVQKKLVDAMDNEINKFISAKGSLIKPDSKLVIEKNEDVARKAIQTNSFNRLLDEIEYRIGTIESKDLNTKELKNRCNSIKKEYESLSKLVVISKETDNLSTQIRDTENNLRKAVRSFFESYRRIYEGKNSRKKLSESEVLKQFPSLETVYPQVSIKNKKVLVMTVHKAMYGIDPILSEKIDIDDFSEKNKRTLILFDESDQAAIAMRSVIIEQEIEKNGGYNRFAKGYNGYLQYSSLINNSEHLSNAYYGEELEKALVKAQNTTKKNWSRWFNNVPQYNNIFLEGDTELESYRRGVFFSGQTLRLNISKRGDTLNSFICYKKGKREFHLVHSDDESKLRSQYAIVVKLDDFLSLTIRNTIAIKSQLGKIIANAFEQSKKRFEDEIKNVSTNSSDKSNYLSYPTLEREIHTLLSRFETSLEFQFERQLNDFMTNRKNIIVSDGSKEKKIPDSTVYSQGVQLYQEEVDERDNLHRVRLSCREINNTPEKIITDLIKFDNTTVVLCSATASNMSVVSNFDIQYFQDSFSSKIHRLSNEERTKFDDLVAKTYPKKHKINIVRISNHQYEDKRVHKISLPEKYKSYFPPNAQELAERWLKITVRGLEKDKDSKSVFFYLNRYFQFIEAYHYFITHNGIHSMIFFQNKRGDRDANHFQTLSCLIDGSFKDMPSELDGEIPTDWKNEHIRISKDFDEVESEILSELSGNKDAKLMLISAYASFKAGTNLQYNIPENLSYISGDTWDKESPKKDWDAMYLQSPTSYFSTDDDPSENKYETNVYKAMLTLMMLYERGCLAKYEVASLLYSVLSATPLYFSEDTYQGVIKDKAAWAQSIIEQAVGRLCRTKNKSNTTHILYDEAIANFFNYADLDKSLTKEFRTLANDIKQCKIETTSSPEEEIRCNNANYAQSQLNRIRRSALHFTPHNNDMFDYEDDIDEETDEIPYFVHINQVINQSYKQTIIKKPVIVNFDELTTEDRQLTFISKCYGDWQRNENGEFSYSLDNNHCVCSCGKENAKSYSISPSTVRLDVLMKNNVIREYFEKKGYATDWKLEGYILHPQILAYDYAGEIGEEAFKALVLHYTDCKEDDIKHLEDKDYELADFVICNSDGSYKIAFDVKNMNPDFPHYDKPNDIPTLKKRKTKCERLGCELITVNILKLNDSPIDEIREIGGMIDNDGNVIWSAIETLKKLISNGKKNNN